MNDEWLKDTLKRHDERLQRHSERIDKLENTQSEMAVKIDDIIYGKGIGKSKKEAEQNAALDALNKSVVK